MPNLEESGCATARLYRFVEKMVGARANNESQPEALKRIFGLETADSVAVTKKYAELWQLLAESRGEITQVGGPDVSRGIESIGELEKAFVEFALNRNWSDVHNRMSDPSVRAFYYVARDVAWAHPTLRIAPDELKKLREEAVQLLQNVKDSSSDPKLKSLIVAELNYIIEMMDSYEISGVEGIERAIRQSIGTIVLCPEAHAAKARPTVKEFVDFLKNVTIAAAAVKGVASAIEAVHKVMKMLGYEVG